MLGNLFVVRGPMFAGKTEWVIAFYRNLIDSGAEVHVFKPVIDNRYGGFGALISHNKNTIPATLISQPADIMENIQDWLDPTTGLATRQVWVIVDEAQFLQGIAGVVQSLVSSGVNVVCAGLDLDFLRQPFGEMPTLIGMSTKAIQLKAKCSVCGGEAVYTQRIIDGVPAKRSDPVVLVGGGDSYEARCGGCHEISG